MVLFYILLSQCMSIKSLNQQVPDAKESVEWVHLNSFMDGSLGSFESWLNMRVMSEFYDSQKTWCQGSANLSYALLAGLSQFRSARSKMNGFSRRFKKNPKRQSMRTSRNMNSLKELLLNKSMSVSDRAVYIEFDVWCHDKDNKERASSKTTFGPEWKSTGTCDLFNRSNKKKLENYNHEFHRRTRVCDSCESCEKSICSLFLLEKKLLPFAVDECAKVWSKRVQSI